jgi:hypothetical protein
LGEGGQGGEPRVLALLAQKQGIESEKAPPPVGGGFGGGGNRSIAAFEGNSGILMDGGDASLES